MRLSTTPLATTVAIALAEACFCSDVHAQQWQAVNDDAREQRLVNRSSLRNMQGIRVYQLWVKWGDGRHEYRRTAVADCAARTRFEVTDSEDWQSQPFKAVFAGTRLADELNWVCAISLPEESTNPFAPFPRLARARETQSPAAITSSNNFTTAHEAQSTTTPTPSSIAPSLDPADSIQATSAQGLGKRIALVIGNAKYDKRPLRNPENDANDISRALKLSGFSVIDLRNGNLAQMRQSVRQFGDQLLHSDVGLVYYAGHAVEVRGRNYFIPVNADVQREDEIADQGLDAGLILEKMSSARKGVNILIVDACRDDPFGRGFRSTSSGLALMEAPQGTLIAYATSPGKVAADGEGRNSPYTKHLLSAMQVPNRPVEQVFKAVRRSVQIETKNLQTPWENTSLSGDFYFRVRP
jgi:hypothetical protein